MIRGSIRTGKRREEALQTTILREFDGGWNVIDNDLSLSTKFAKVLDNVTRKDDGSLGIRWGTRLFVDLTALTTEDIINVEYFQDHIIAVMADGEVYSISATGVATVRWDTTIATALGVSMWTTTDFVSFAAYNGELIICNGIDKPLLLDLLATNPCQYLVDLGTGTNANTPICRYVTVSTDYVVMAGDPVDPDRIHISNGGTSGTWYGDPVPNDAAQVDLAKKVQVNHPTINGIIHYKNSLIIAFDEVLVVGTLGNYSTDTTPLHQPIFDNVFFAHGAISHRSLVHIADDVMMCDSVGTPALARTIFADTITPERPSELIDPAIQANLQELTTAGLLKNVWGIYNQLEKQYMLFMPNHEDNAFTLETDPFYITDVATKLVIVFMVEHHLIEGESVTFAGATGFNSLVAGDLNKTHTVNTVLNSNYFTIIVDGTVDNSSDDTGGGASVTAVEPRTESTGYVMTHRSIGKKTRVWSRFKGWNFDCGCKSLLNRIFLAKGSKIYVYGTNQDPIYQDFVADSAVDISWVWETPWTSMKQRMNIKRLRYIGFDTRGDALFTAQMYVDDIYRDENGYLDPTLEMNFYGGDLGGYGSSTQPFGGGRPTNNERLYGWTTKGKLFKLRLEGVSDRPLRIIAVLLAFLKGSIRR